MDNAVTLANPSALAVPPGIAARFSAMPMKSRVSLGLGLAALVGVIFAMTLWSSQGDYKVLYFVGAGTFARVYRAVHKETGKMFAVKVLRSNMSNPKEMNAKTHKPNKLYIDLFRREGEFGMFFT